MSDNLFSPPKSHVTDVVGETSRPLWNPNAAANWSLLFSPAFGAFLHMKNWQALDQPDKAAMSKIWFFVSLILPVGLGIASVMSSSTALAAAVRPVGIALLISWYFGSARGQASYVKTHFGDAYPRRGWLKPLGIAVLSVFALIVVVGVFVAITSRILSAR